MKHISCFLPVFLTLFFVSDVVAKTDKYRIMWREDPATTMVIGWNQISGTDATVYYDVYDHGKDVLAYSFSTKTDHHNYFKGMNNHFVRLKDLSPSTIYYFVIKDSEGCSERLSFQTAPDNPHERLSIIAGGDSRNYRAARQKANRMVSKLRPHCVMFGGDMTGGDNATQWKAWMDDWQQTITEDGKLTPVIITRGNHEYSNETLVKLFDIPTAQAYYALSLGGNLLRAYTLNSLIPSGGHQKAWLKKDLEASQDHFWRVAQYHFAIRPHTAKKSERNNQAKDWSTLFEKYKVKLAVESDAHCVKWTYPIRPSRGFGSDEGFVRDDEKGTVYIGEGCWGAPLRRNNDDKKWTRNSGSFNQFKWIFVSTDFIEIRTVKTDNADEVSSVESHDIFNPPPGIDLWNPSNGSVVIIENDANTPANFAQASVQGPPADMRLLNFDVNRNDEGITIQWQTEYEGSLDRIFEIQKSHNGNIFQTLAEIKSKGPGNHSYDFFEFNDGRMSQSVAYRIKEKKPDGRFQVYSTKTIAANLNAAGETPKVNRLIPDNNNGLVRAKYVVEEDADIAIRLIDREKKILAKSDYKNQQSGNYLQSIDMNRFPEGQYMLTIKAGEEVIQKYLVVK